MTQSETGGPVAVPGAKRRAEGDRTRTLIMDTAQMMFGERGIDGVSINEVCRRCNVNSAAIHYHFGSKQGLVQAILKRGVDSWGNERDRLVEEIERGGNPSLRQVVEVMIRPTVNLVKQDWGLHYVRFLFALSNHPEYGNVGLTTADAYTERYLALLGKVVPGLPRDVLLRRYTLTRVFLYQALSIENGPIASWLSSHGGVPADDFGDELADYFTAALSAPVNSPT